MKTYYMRFGSGDPRTYTGVAATFLLFKTSDGTNITPPGITEVPSATGIYYFNYGTTTSISFLADAATTSPGAALRYVTGSIDPADRADEYGNTLVAISTTLSALGNTSIALGLTTNAIAAGFNTTLTALIGTTASSFGGLSTMPVDLFGYVKRFAENLEGNQSYDKSAFTLSFYDRGSSTLLATKTITNSATLVTKT